MLYEDTADQRPQSESIGIERTGSVRVHNLEGYREQLASFQSNHEGELIDFLHENSSSDYAIVNPGAFTHTSIALRDAFASVAIPFIEVHISNVYAREEFRHHSYLSPIASGCIVGCGTAGYRMAAELVVRRLTRK